MSQIQREVVWGQNLQSTRWARNYSTWRATTRCSVENFQLDPLWVTGFCDGEGSFNVSVRKNKNYKQGWLVEPRFQLTQHGRDKGVLKGIQNYFKVGSIYQHGPQILQFRVTSIKELQKFIDHFGKYPLITKKTCGLWIMNASIWNNWAALTSNSLRLTSNCRDQSFNEPGLIWKVKISLSWCSTSNCS